MDENIKALAVDIKDLRWGKSPVPLLPKSLRSLWENELLPDWLCNDLGLPLKSQITLLDSNSWNKIEEITPRIKNYLRFIVRTRGDQISDLPCWQSSVWPLGLNPNDISVEIRIKNQLIESSIFSDFARFIKLTFGEILSLKSVGPLAVIDFVSTVDYILEYYNEKLSHLNSEIENTDFRSLVTEEWLGQVYFDDPRFTQYLLPNKESLKDMIDLVLSDPYNLENIKILPRLKESIAQIKKLKSQIDRKSLEEVLMEIIKLSMKYSDQIRLNAIAGRFGWSGDKPKSLEECGNKLGITRERMRQIQKSFLKKIPNHEIYFPQLDKAIELLERNCPIECTEAVKLLNEAGITKIEFNIHGILEAINVYRRESSLRISDLGDQEYLTDKPENKLLQFIKNTSRKLSGHSGVSNVYQVLDVADDYKFATSEDECKKILVSLKEIEFLNDDWFWNKDIKDHRNRLYNTSRKILSVISPQKIFDIREGIRRAYNKRSLSSTSFKRLIIPPIAVLTEFFQRHPEFRVEGEYVYFNDILNYKQELGDVECVLVEAVRSTPLGVIDRESLAKYCISRGMNDSTFTVMTTYSPILEHVETSIWKLRGSKIDSASIHAVRIISKLKPRNKRVLDFGWNNDGKLWIAVRVPLLTSNFVIGSPGSIRRLLSGQTYIAFDKDDMKQCGNIIFDERGTSYGYGVFARKIGLDLNDILLAEFDLAKNVVYLSVGDEDLLED